MKHRNFFYEIFFEGMNLIEIKETILTVKKLSWESSLLVTNVATTSQFFDLNFGRI